MTSGRSEAGRGMGGPTETGPPSRSAIDRVLAGLVGIEQAAAALLLMAIVGLVFAQVVARYVFGSPFYWSDELARYTYVWFAFVSAVFVTAQRRHIQVDLFSGLLGRRGKLVLESLVAFIVIGTCIFLVWGSWNWLLSNLTPRSSALRLPMIWLYGVVWICFAAMALHTLINLIRVLSGAIPVDQPTGHEDGAL